MLPHSGMLMSRSLRALHLLVKNRIYHKASDRNGIGTVQFEIKWRFYQV